MSYRHESEPMPPSGLATEVEHITAEHAAYTSQLDEDVVTVIHRIQPPSENRAIESSFITKIGPFALLEELGDYSPPDRLGYGDRMTFLKPDSATTVFDEKNNRKVVLNYDGKPLIVNGTRRKLNHIKEGRPEKVSKRLKGRNVRFIW